MLKAFKTILSGKIYYCSEVAFKIVESGDEKKTTKIQAKTILTHWVTEKLQMLAMEFTIGEIAKRLFEAKRTIIPTGKTS